MITVVSEVDGMPLGTLKRGKPRVGDSIIIDDVPYEVIERDRDTVVVRKPDAAPRYERPYYEPNPPISRLAGFKSRYKRNWPYEKDLPFKKYEQGPIYPPELSRPSYSVPSAEPHVPAIPHWAPAYGTGYQMPFQQPLVYTAVHYKYFVPIFRMETYRPPMVGARERFGGEDYTFVKIEGNTILAKPDRNWNYAVVAIDKTSGEAIFFLPAVHRSEISNVKYRLKHWIETKKGIPRRDYHMTYMPFRKITRYLSNPKSIPKYTR